MKSYLIVIGILIATLLPITMLSPAFAAYPKGYTLKATGTGTCALSFAQFHSAPRSVQMATVVGADTARIGFSGDGTLGTITALSYWVYAVQAGTFSQNTAYIQIYLSSDPSIATYNDWIAAYIANPNDPRLEYLQAEPYYTWADKMGGGGNIIPILNMWTKWDAFGATPLEWESLEEIISLPHNAPTLAQYIAGTGGPNYQTFPYGGLTISSIKITMGNGGPWVSTLAYVDDVTINDYFENFGTQVMVTSSPDTGFGYVKVDGVDYGTPYTFIWNVGDTHTLEIFYDTLYWDMVRRDVWTDWSDGGAKTHTYTVPAYDDTVTANYKVQYYLTVNSVDPGTTVGEGWYDANTMASFHVTSPLYYDMVRKLICTGYHGDASGSGTSGSILMDYAHSVTFSGIPIGT